VLRDVGGAANLVFVPCDEDSIAGHDQIGLDIVGALLNGQTIGFQGVFRTLAAGASMRNYNNIGQGGSPLVGRESNAPAHTRLRRPEPRALDAAGPIWAELAAEHSDHAPTSGSVSLDSMAFAAA